MGVSTTDAIDGLLAHGRFAVSTAKAAELLGVPDSQVRARMHRMVQSGRVFSPARGLWMAVPPEYRSWGVLPGTVTRRVTGGTCLHKLHLDPPRRYSEDLDYMRATPGGISPNSPARSPAWASVWASR